MVTIRCPGFITGDVAGVILADDTGFGAFAAAG